MVQGDIELLLLAFQHCGFQLRSDDPDRVRALMVSIEGKAREQVGISSARMEVLCPNVKIPTTRADGYVY